MNKIKHSQSQESLIINAQFYKRWWLWFIQFHYKTPELLALIMENRKLKVLAFQNVDIKKLFDIQFTTHFL